MPHASDVATLRQLWQPEPPSVGSLKLSMYRGVEAQLKVSLASNSAASRQRPSFIWMRRCKQEPVPVCLESTPAKLQKCLVNSKRCTFGAQLATQNPISVAEDRVTMLFKNSRPTGSRTSYRRLQYQASTKLHVIARAQLTVMELFSPVGIPRT